MPGAIPPPPLRPASLSRGSSPPMLDPSLVSLTYLDEGAANIVYRISASPSTSPTRSSHYESYSRTTPPPSEIDPRPIRPSSSNPFPGQLLRLRKDNATAAVLDSHHHFNNRIAPLLPPANLIQQTLVRASSHLIQQCNAGLRAMEKRGARSPQRAGVYLAEGEAFAVLVTDMSSSNTSSDPDAPAEAETESLSVEFKPKWLAQSPNAPSNGTSRRCRTCALRALRESRGPMPGDEKLLSSGSGFCPLKLMEQDRSIVREVGNRIVELNRIRKEDRGWMEETLFAWLYGNALLARLRTLQVVMDPEGVLMGNLESPDFLTAMTMRDCTLFLRIPKDGGPIEARLGDLDLKAASPKKADYWRRVERQLIDDGWYTATGRGAAVDSEERCQLSL